MSFLSTHKKIDAEKFAEKVKQVNEDFVQFQLDHNIRAVIRNVYGGDKNYPPNILVDLITSFCQLDWREMPEEEKQSLMVKLAKEQGIDLK